MIRKNFTEQLKNCVSLPVVNRLNINWVCKKTNDEGNKQ